MPGELHYPAPGDPTAARHQRLLLAGLVVLFVVVAAGVAWLKSDGQRWTCGLDTAGHPVAYRYASGPPAGVTPGGCGNPAGVARRSEGPPARPKAEDGPDGAIPAVTHPTIAPVPGGILEPQTKATPER